MREKETGEGDAEIIDLRPFIHLRRLREECEKSLGTEKIPDLESGLEDVLTPAQGPATTDEKVLKPRKAKLYLVVDNTRSKNDKER